MDREAWRGYSPWGHKESDPTEATKHAPSLSLFMFIVHPAQGLLPLTRKQKAVGPGIKITPQTYQKLSSVPSPLHISSHLGLISW